MSEPIKSARADGRVLAALAVLGWPDDRERSAHVEEDGYEVTPVGHYWSIVCDVLAAADLAAELDLRAEVARVRADVAEDLARVIERRAAEYDGAPRFVLNDLAEDLRQGRLAPAESVVGAPTPAAGTQQRPEAIPVRAVPQTWSSHLGNAWFAIARPRVRPGDRIAVSFDGNDNVWYGRVAGVRPGVGGEVWIDATPVGALPVDEGTRQEGLINVEE